VSILSGWDEAVDRSLNVAAEAVGGVFREVRFVRSPSDLDILVKLTHDSLGVEHEDEGFSRERRRQLYSDWVQSNPQSIMLLTPQHGCAQDKTIGVSIILPLKDRAVSQMWSGCGVLSLGKNHISKARIVHVNSN
jgi:hypothetical protein